ncbi:MAG: hypothetical protein H6657_02745 [Ardenticatenaceae bacterium]|nr:hypothetical protein [Ardenticatenaceae bacterium]
MTQFSPQELHDFIVRAKAYAYVGNGSASLAYRPGSHDIQYHETNFAYIDSYFGGTDFLGQEVVYFHGTPVWAMNYYGKILRPDLYSGAQAGQVIKESLSLLYQDGRFLGPFTHETANGIYFDTNDGDVFSFTGYEWIELDREKVYDLHYHGGLVKV